MPSNEPAIDFQEIEGETELTPPEKYAANLIEWAAENHASDLFLSDAEKSVLIAIRRLGKVEPVRRLARDYGRRLQGHLRVLADSDPGEMLRPTEGRGVVETPNGSDIDIRLSTMPTLFGQDVSIRLYDPSRGARRLEELGMDDWELKAVKNLLDLQSGLILVAGPVNSGKSSSLYAALRYLNDGTRKIHTLEDPIEHAIPGVMQTAVNVRAGLDFADLLATVFRHSPDVIMIGEIRDKRTAATAVRAGASGQLVLATIHAKAAAEAVDAMRQYGADPKFLAAALTGVINQRLIRRLGADTRKRFESDEPMQVPARVAERLGDREPVVNLSKPAEDMSGRGSDDGFDALTCLPEILVVNKEISEAIGREASASELHRIAVEQGMLSLGDAAALRVYRGDTTPSEATRVVNDPELAALAARCRESCEN